MNYFLKFTLAGGDRLVQKLRDTPSTIRSVISMDMQLLMDQLAVYIRARKLTGSPLQSRTGKLAASVNVTPTRIEGNKIIGEVTAADNTAFYGRVHERGGSAFYPIMAVHRRALHFLGGDGQSVFARTVQHPPAFARPFVAPSLQENKADIIAGLQDALNEALRKE
jgi:hypothetical protein